MNERLTIQDLTDLLAAKHSMAKKDADAFVKEFFLLIEQALENEKIVKIKGLGTFRLIDVDSRESVKITTGERFQIKGHTKVSFSPDPSLRDIINKPFAHFETVVLNENTVLEDTLVEEAEEEEAGEEEAIITEDVVKEEIMEAPAIVKEELIEQPGEVESEEVVTKEVVKEEVAETEVIVPETETIVTETQVTVAETEVIVPPTEVVVPPTEEIVSPTEEMIAPLAGEEWIKKEELTAEQIIEQELMKANLKPEIPPQPEPTNREPTNRESINWESINRESIKQEAIKPESVKATNTPSPAVKKASPKKASPQNEKSPVPYLITIIVLVLLLCGSAVLFIYYPDLFSSSSEKDALAMSPVTTQPVQPEAQLSDTIKKEENAMEGTPETEQLIEGTQPTPSNKETITEKKEIVTPATKEVATSAKQVVAPPATKEVPVSAKRENKTVQQQPPVPVLPDSASYRITGTKTKYTIKEGETLTRVSLRFYGTKALWPYIVKYNPTVIKNPNHVPYGTVVRIPELTKE